MRRATHSDFVCFVRQSNECPYALCVRSRLKVQSVRIRGRVMVQGRVEAGRWVVLAECAELFLAGALLRVYGPFLATAMTVNLKMTLNSMTRWSLAGSDRN